MSDFRTEIEQGLKPNLIDELEGVTYCGYAEKGDLTKCAIIRYRKVDTVTFVESVNGRFNFGSNWADRLDLNYSLKNLK